VGIGLARLVADAAAQADTSEDVNTLAVRACYRLLYRGLEPVGEVEHDVRLL